MPFDIDMLRTHYNTLAQKVDQVKSVLNRPLDLDRKDSLHAPSSGISIGKL